MDVKIDDKLRIETQIEQFIKDSKDQNKWVHPVNKPKSKITYEKEER